MCDFGYILSPDEKYMIIFGRKDIYILKLNEMKFYESSIKMPVDSSRCNAVLVRNSKSKIVVYGYIKMLSQTINELIELIPNELIELIASYYNTYNVHLIATDTFLNGMHFRINLNDIIESPMKPVIT